MSVGCSWEEEYALTYLGPACNRNLEYEEVGHQTLQGKGQTVDVHGVDQTQAALEGQSGHQRQRLTHHAAS